MNAPVPVTRLEYLQIAAIGANIPHHRAMWELFARMVTGRAVTFEELQLAQRLYAPIPDGVTWNDIERSEG